ncbi:hypothetical protein BR93DRAFT_79593 [Coniochaeta sp. PMI_546]|nr:hypothetical protein BR93DRAFT_79593 [Coniochaeta sp. PMI_546]
MISQSSLEALTRHLPRQYPRQALLNVHRDGEPPRGFDWRVILQMYVARTGEKTPLSLPVFGRILCGHMSNLSKSVRRPRHRALRLRRHPWSLDRCKRTGHSSCTCFARMRAGWCCHGIPLGDGFSRGAWNTAAKTHMMHEIFLLSCNMDRVSKMGVGNAGRKGSELRTVSLFVFG